MSTSALPASLGGYDLVGELGSGGFGSVYAARKRRLDRPVALKVLHPHLTRDPEVVARFEREARAAARFRHPHIVAVTDIGEADGAHFLEMELLEGESLKDRLARAPLSAAETADVLVPVCAAVAAVHDAGIVHRDIKPANIFLTAALPGVVHPKLLDFGIAQLRDGSRAVTASDAFLGSVAYMAPEQMYNARDVDARADQWSLGVTAYECLTGRVPFDAKSVPEAVTAVLAGKFLPPRALDGALPEALEAIVLRALAREPDARFPSVRALGAALLAFASPAVQQTYAASFGQGVAASTPTPPTPALTPPTPPPVAPAPLAGLAVDATQPASPRTTARSRSALVVLVACALALLAAGVWRWSRPTPAPVAAVPSPAVVTPVVAVATPAPVAAPPAAPTALPATAPIAAPAPPPTGARPRRSLRLHRAPGLTPPPDATVGSRGVTIL